jgi:DNA-binding GntR family transcriptional regulator
MLVIKTEDEDTSGDTSRAEFAYRKLLEGIRLQQFPPGARIREVEVARTLGVSRTPVRQALQRLQTRGLLDYAPGRGLVVSELTRQQVMELYAIRELNEGAAARLAAQHASSADIEAMRSLLAEFRSVAPDPVKLAHVNRLLRQSIYDAAHNRYLLQSLADMRDTLALLRGTTYSLEDRWRSADSENTEIVEAIARRDPDAAELAARKHIREALKARLKIFQGA